MARWHRLVWVLVACLAAQMAGAAAHAADRLTVGKSTPQALCWIPVDVGVEAGLFRRDGLDVEIMSFTGGAKMHQAMVAGSVELGLGSGTDYAFLVKGAPEKAIAVMSDRLGDFGVVVGAAGQPVNSLADLKGGRIGVTGPGTMTMWLATELGRSQGWAPDAAPPLAVGGGWAAYTAALETRQVRAVIADPSFGFKLEQNGKGRVLALASSFTGDFLSHVMFATDAALAAKPDAVRRFVRAWFESVRYMRDNRTPALEAVRRVTGLDAESAARSYDLVMPVMLDSGGFSPAGIAALSRALTDLRLVEQTPDLLAVTTEAYLPGDGRKVN